MADVNLIAEEPDLAVIGYGGNDGNPTANVPREEFKQNIIQIIEYARQGNSDCEIILMGNMQGNPDAKPTYRQEELNGALAEIAEEQEGVIFVDIMSLHHYMLETKRYIDLSANNVNHASDFFARCFAMMTCARLIDYDTILK